jgi:hypothetical protein
MESFLHLRRRIAGTSKLRGIRTLVCQLMLVVVCLFSAAAQHQKGDKKVSEPHPVTKQEANAIAERIIRAAKPSADYVVMYDETIERDFGWVYSYFPRKFLETKDYNYLVPGAGPLLVLRENGSTLFLPTSVSTDAAIEAFEEKWQQSKKNQ